VGPSDAHRVGGWGRRFAAALIILAGVFANRSVVLNTLFECGLELLTICSERLLDCARMKRSLQSSTTREAKFTRFRMWSVGIEKKSVSTTLSKQQTAVRRWMD
jgi:hypothetical protein